MGDVNSSPAGSPRLGSIDAYRGLVMLLMMAEVLHFHDVAKKLPGSPIWDLLAQCQTHVPWSGCSLHDLIQPSFSFLVGVALPFSLASRMVRGQSFARQAVHALWRDPLIALGIFLPQLANRRLISPSKTRSLKLGWAIFSFFCWAEPRR